MIAGLRLATVWFRVAKVKMSGGNARRSLVKPERRPRACTLIRLPKGMHYP